MLEGKWRRKILFVGDRAEDAEIVLKACRATRHELQQVFDKEKIPKDFRLCGSVVELIILDIDMLGSEGVEIVKTICLCHPGLSILVLTDSYKRQVECCVFLGIEAFVHRPYSPEGFLGRILAVLDRKRKRRKTFETVLGNPSAKVLIANERKEICELLCVVLTEDVLNARFDVAWACSGEDVLRVSREFKPDIGILDVKVSDMQGHELIDHFKAGKGHLPKDFIIYSNSAEKIQTNPVVNLGYPVFWNLTQLETLVDCLKELCFKHRLVCEA